MLVCPKDAIRRAWPEEPVLIDAEACVGCGFCVLVCPFGVVEVAGDPKVALQCDVCADRREAGEEPACVAACPTAALRCVELDDRLREERCAVGSLVAEFLAAHAAGPDEKQRRVCCELCGRDVAPRKLLEQLRAKLPANVPVGNVCPRCRRSRSAAIFAERLAYVGTAEGRKEAGSVGPGGCPET
jgi:ferredoxin